MRRAREISEHRQRGPQRMVHTNVWATKHSKCSRLKIIIKIDIGVSITAPESVGHSEPRCQPHYTAVTAWPAVVGWLLSAGLPRWPCGPDEGRWATFQVWVTPKQVVVYCQGYCRRCSVGMLFPSLCCVTHHMC